MINTNTLQCYTLVFFHFWLNLIPNCLYLLAFQNPKKLGFSRVLISKTRVFENRPELETLSADARFHFSNLQVVNFLLHSVKATQDKSKRKAENLM